eukprot:NODE_14_length_51535_cov_1.125049.p42 type:complete len:121 gc:universal NODE_14_length_51535_cov_1.125049:45527-45889(+)
MSSNTKTNLQSVMYIILRNDLKWKTGPLITQACHAVSLLIHKYGQNDCFKNYLNTEYDMRKVTLGASIEEFDKISQVLKEKEIDFVEWQERPENIKTAIAIVPLEEPSRPPILRSLKLYK